MSPDTALVSFCAGLGLIAFGGGSIWLAWRRRSRQAATEVHGRMIYLYKGLTCVMMGALFAEFGGGIRFVHNGPGWFYGLLFVAIPIEAVAGLVFLCLDRKSEQRRRSAAEADIEAYRLSHER